MREGLGSGVVLAAMRASTIKLRGMIRSLRRKGSPEPGACLLSPFRAPGGVPWRPGT